MARIKTGRMQLKTYRSGTSSVYLYETDDAFRDAFNEAVDRLRAMEVTYITVPEDEDAGSLQALTELHAAVELGTLGAPRRRWVQQLQERLTSRPMSPNAAFSQSRGKVSQKKENRWVSRSEAPGSRK